MAKGKFHDWLTEDGLLKLEGWARDGLTDEQIAKNIGIGNRTYYEWLARFPQIAQATKKGKEVVDRLVENALLKRALGYTFDEVTMEFGLESKRVTKEVQPDTTAQIFWLKNRKPREWRDKQEIESTNVNHNTTQDVGQLTPEERKARIEELNRRRGD